MGTLEIIGLNVMLRSQSPLHLLLQKEEAERILEDWQSSAAKLRNQLTLYGVTADNVRWAVRVDDVIGMHTFDPRRMQQPQIPGGTNVPHLLGRPDGSGLPIR